MLKPHIRRRADSGNINRHTGRVMIAMDVSCKQPASPATVKKGAERQCGRCCICPTAKDSKTELETLPVLRTGVQGPLYQDNSNNK